KILFFFKNPCFSLLFKYFQLLLAFSIISFFSFFSYPFLSLRVFLPSTKPHTCTGSPLRGIAAAGRRTVAERQCSNAGGSRNGEKPVTVVFRALIMQI
ncbi:MAG: hypothetical protein UIB61_03625, partial [Treponema sp.]|nr:hypothetical protein [Treponema sp.]